MPPVQPCTKPHIQECARGHGAAMAAQPVLRGCLAHLRPQSPLGARAPAGTAPTSGGGGFQPHPLPPPGPERDAWLRRLFGPAAALRAPLAHSFGAKLAGVGIAAPLAPEQAAALIALWHEYRVLVLPGQAGLSLEAFERFSNHFGCPTPHPSVASRVDGHPNVQLLSNVQGGYISADNRAAADATLPPITPSPHHTDLDYETEPSSASMLLCETAPCEGGFTSFVDVTAALDALPTELREAAESLSVVRTPFQSFRLYAKAARNEAPLVRRHPHTRRKSLHVSHPDLMREFSNESGEALVERLRRHLLEPSPSFEYLHAYARGDLVVWDNLALMHQGPIEGVSVADASHPRARLLFRVTVKGEPATALPRRDAGWWVDTHIIDADAAPA